MYAHLIIELENQIKTLRQRLKQLAEEIKRQPIRQVRVFAIPPVMPQSTHLPYSRISVATFDGPPALEMALHALSHFEASPGISTKSVFRLPGVIVIAPSGASVISEALGHINALKSEIQKTAQLIYPESPNQRHRVIHRTFPRLVMLQLTRQIKNTKTPVYSCNFTWVRKQAIKRLSKQEAAEFVLKMKAIAPNELSQEIPWEQKVEAEAAQIGSLPKNSQLRYRRPVKAHPMVNLAYIEQHTTPRGLQRKQQMIDGNLPLIVFSDLPIKIGRLPDFDPSKPKSLRQSKVNDQDPVTAMSPIFLVNADGTKGPDSL